MKTYRKAIFLILPILSGIICLAACSKTDPAVSTIVGDWTETSLMQVKQSGTSPHRDTTILYRTGYSLGFTLDKRFHYGSPGTSEDGYYKLEGNSIRETVPSSQSSAVINIIKLTDHTLMTQTRGVGIESGIVTISTYTYSR